jgi:hypothetical protein
MGAQLDVRRLAQMVVVTSLARNDACSLWPRRYRSMQPMTKSLVHGCLRNFPESRLTIPANVLACASGLASVGKGCWLNTR